MCGGSTARGSRIGTKGTQGPRFFGADVESMSPKGRIAAALTVLVPVAMSGIFLIAFVPDLWWIFTIYGWVAFPAFGVLSRGVSRIAEDRREVGEEPTITVESKEQRLLEALRDHGELTPALAALETSISVAEAEKILRELAEGGYLEVMARDGGVFYSLWGKS
ncbi:MAG: hypothetical protein ACRDSJ_21940 [Rubrobacteraceae bacterium]